MNFKKMTYLCMQRLTNFPYIEEDFDALTNYELLCKVVEYLNKVIANENNQNEAINELAEAFTNLKNYVDNLDLQEEVNNKLDEMYENGQLSDLVAQYLGLAGMITYDTVSDMKSAQNLVNGSKCATLGYHSVNDGGGAFYKIRTVTNDDVVNEMNIIEVYDNLLVAELIDNENISLKQLGAIGDDTADDTLIVSFAINNFKNVHVNKGTFKVTSNIGITNICNLYGDNESTIHFTAGTENLSIGSGKKLNVFNVKFISDAGTLYHINNTNVKNTRIENNNIKSNSYAILVNANTDGGQDLFISKNKIETNSDGVEINTTSDESNKFKNTIISDNIISITGGSSSSSGFGIGVADGKNVVISNNIIDEARQEGIHVEDTYKEVVIDGNVLTNCHKDGIRIYGIINNVDRCIVSNNAIKGDKTSGFAGIITPTTSSGNTREISLFANTINNFDIGISAYRNINVEGTIIENCNMAFNPSIQKIKGKLSLIETPVIANFTNDELTEIEHIDIFNNDSLNIDNFITSSNAKKIIRLKHLAYKIILPISSTESTREIKFLKLPTYMDAIITTSISTGGTNWGKGVAHTTYNSTDGVNNTVISVANNGTFSSPANVLLSTDEQYLCVKPYNPNQSSGNMTMEIVIDGDIIIKGQY